MDIVLAKLERLSSMPDTVDFIPTDEGVNLKGQVRTMLLHRSQPE